MIEQLLFLKTTMRTGIKQGKWPSDVLVHIYNISRYCSNPIAYFLFACKKRKTLFKYKLPGTRALQLKNEN